MPKHLIQDGADYVEDGTHDVRDGKMYFPFRATVHDVTNPSTGEIYYVAASGELAVWNGSDWDLFEVVI